MIIIRYLWLTMLWIVYLIWSYVVFDNILGTVYHYIKEKYSFKNICKNSVNDIMSVPSSISWILLHTIFIFTYSLITFILY